MGKRRGFPFVPVREGRFAVTHPGEWLFQGFMREYSVSQNALARAMGVSPRRVNEIVNGRRRITGETAVLLEEATGISARQWMAFQAEHELALAHANLARRPRTKTPLRELTESQEYDPDWLALEERTSK